MREVLAAISLRLKNTTMPEPTQDILKKVSNEFYQMWNFPNCCGAIDGKHIRIICPDNSGSLYFNYKSFFSIVSLAVVDTNNKFIIVDIGSYGKEGDAGILPKSNLGKLISTGQFKFPEPRCLPNTDIVLPHVFVGDEAFKLTNTMMRPYPRDQSKADVTKAIFNYRLSRARPGVPKLFCTTPPSGYLETPHAPLHISAFHFVIPYFHGAVHTNPTCTSMCLLDTVSR